MCTSSYNGLHNMLLCLLYNDPKALLAWYGQQNLLPIPHQPFLSGSASFTPHGLALLYNIARTGQNSLLAACHCAACASLRLAGEPVRNVFALLTNTAPLSILGMTWRASLPALLRGRLQRTPRCALSGLARKEGLRACCDAPRLTCFKRLQNTRALCEEAPLYNATPPGLAATREGLRYRPLPTLGINRRRKERRAVTHVRFLPTLRTATLINSVFSLGVA